jgi:hypothetical protein
MSAGGIKKEGMGTASRFYGDLGLLNEKAMEAYHE